MYRVELARRAERDLEALPKPVQRRLAEAIDALSDEPRPQGVRKLSSADELYRIRVGDYRVVYKISEEALVVLVIRIGHRRDIYRLLE